MIKPHLVDLDQFKPRPPPQIIPSPKDIQSQTNFYMSIALIGVIILGCYFLYYKLRSKNQEKIKYQNEVLTLKKIRIRKLDYLLSSWRLLSNFFEI